MSNRLLIRTSLRHLATLSVVSVVLAGGLTLALGARMASACPGTTTVSSTSSLDTALGSCWTTINIVQGTYSGPFVVSRSVNIVGAVESTTILKGGSPVVNVTAGTVTIENLTITGGTDSVSNGAGLQNDGALTLMNVNVSANTESEGGDAAGIYNDGAMTIQNSLVVRNSGSGGRGVGGIWNDSDGTMTIQNSTISQNVNSGVGGTGGILQGCGGDHCHHRMTTTLEIYQSTISNNSAPNGGYGGGIDSAIPVYLSGVSITGNTATFGGGIYNANLGTATIMGGLISGNTAEFGGGIDNWGTLTMSGAGGVDGNNATQYGGGIANWGIANLTTTTVQNNHAGIDGGGICNYATLNPVGTSVMHNTPDDVVECAGTCVPAP